MAFRRSVGWMRGEGRFFCLRTLTLCFIGCCVLWPSTAWTGGEVGFVANSQLSAQSQRLFGKIALTLQGDETIGHAQVFVYGPSGPQSTLTVPTWSPKQEHTFSFDIPQPHPLPGWYHLLVGIRFKDQAGVWFSSSMGAEYRFGHAVRSQAKPIVTFRGDRLVWPDPPLKRASLTVTTGPHWRLNRASLKPYDSQLKLVLASSDESPLLGWNYTQTARLNWVENGVHQSSVFQWVLQTDSSGHGWHGENQTHEGENRSMGQSDTPWWSSTPFVILVTFFLSAMLMNRKILLDALRKILPRS